MLFNIKQRPNKSKFHKKKVAITGIAINRMSYMILATLPSNEHKVYTKEFVPFNM